MKIIRMLALMALALFVLPLAACATTNPLAGVIDTIGTVKTVITTAADATIPANVALVAANSFDAVEATATNVLVLCTPTAAHTPPAVCAAQRTNIRAMSAAIRAGRPIRNQIEPVATGQASPVSKSAYAKLQAIISTLTAAVATFNAASR